MQWFFRDVSFKRRDGQERVERTAYTVLGDAPKSYHTEVLFHVAGKRRVTI